MQCDAQSVLDWPVEDDDWTVDEWPTESDPQLARLLGVLIGAGLVVVLVIAALVVAVTPGKAGGSPQSVGPSAEPDLGNVTEAMLATGTRGWVTETRDNPGDGSVIGLTPLECGYLTLGFASERRVSGSHVVDRSLLHIALETTAQRPDLGAVVERCARYTYGVRSGGSLRPVELVGLPSWSTAVTDTGNDTWSELIIGGFYRGVYIRAHYSEEDGGLRAEMASALVEIFNEQVDKLARL